MTMKSTDAQMKLTGVPTWSRVDHVGLTVSDLNAAVAFYTEIIGGVELYRIGPLDAAELPKTPDGRDWTEAHMNVAGARLSVATLQLGPDLLLELIEYDKPTDRATTTPKNADIGSHHIGLRVKDIDQAAAYLRSKGLKLMDGPVAVDSGPGAGVKWMYFLDPWGNQMELISR